jgi:hypothetical protein
VSGFTVTATSCAPVPLLLPTCSQLALLLMLQRSLSPDRRSDSACVFASPLQAVTAVGLRLLKRSAAKTSCTLKSYGSGTGEPGNCDVQFTSLHSRMDSVPV